MNKKKSMCPIMAVIFIFMANLPVMCWAGIIPDKNKTSGDDPDEVQRWKGTFTVHFQGETEKKNQDNPELGHTYHFDHSSQIQFTTGKGMVSAPREEEMGVTKGSQEDMMKQLQNGQMDVEAMQKMVQNIQASGFGTNNIMTWVTSIGFDQKEIQSGSVSEEMTVNDKIHEVVSDVGEGYCCNITQEGTWSGKQTTKDFYINLTVNKVTGKYSMEVKWSNVMPTVDYTYDFINLVKCPGWSHSCDPSQKDFSEKEDDYLPMNMTQRTTTIKDPLQDLPIDNPDHLQGTKTLHGLFRVDDTPVDVVISWDIQPVM